MGNWFIFQYHFWFYGMTHEVKPGRATVVPVKAEELMGPEETAPGEPRQRVELRRSEAGVIMVPRNNPL